MKTSPGKALLLASVAVTVQASVVNIPQASHSVGNTIPNQFMVEVDNLSIITPGQIVARVSINIVTTFLLNFSFTRIVSGYSHLMQFMHPSKSVVSFLTLPGNTMRPTFLWVLQ
jgi:hypothetical protein